MKVLLVEPDASLANMIALVLTSEGMICDLAELADDAVDLARHYDFDAIVLAGDLPDMPGLSALRRVRAAGVKAPVLMLSQDYEVAEKVTALSAGADDYLTRPFHKDELVARLRAVIRRSQGHAVSSIACGPIEVDIAAKVARVGGRPIHLTGCEFRMLEVLALRKGSTVTKEAILDGIYGGRDEPELKIIDVFACKIRRKLLEAGRSVGLTGEARVNQHIETVWGRGYRLAETPEPARVKAPSSGRPEGRLRAAVLAELADSPSDFPGLVAAIKPSTEAALRACVSKMASQGLVLNVGEAKAAIYSLTTAGEREVLKVAA